LLCGDADGQGGPARYPLGDIPNLTTPSPGKNSSIFEDVQAPSKMLIKKKLEHLRPGDPDDIADVEL
jgi:hypothetical protein